MVVSTVGAAVLAGILFAGQPAQAADPLPILASNVVLTSTATVRTYTVDLGTLPTRPALVVEVTPDGAHPNMQLQVEATNWLNGPGAPGVCPDATTSIVSSSGPGAVKFVNFTVQNCDPRPGAFAGATVEIRIRALNFGSSSAPASVAVEIRGETRPPTGTLTQQVDTFLNQQQVILPASRDTVLYEDLPTASNGAGDFLWTGEKVVLFPVTIRSDRRSLLVFDVSPAITPVSIIDSAELRLGVTSVLNGGGTVALYRMATASGSSWDEGNANAAGSEFDGATSASIAATWLYRAATFLAWTTPGGDIVGSALASQSITTTGSKTLASTALVAAVQDMATSGDDRDGFMLAGPSATLPTRAVQLASSESATGGQRPELVVLFTPTEIYESGQISTTTKSFISEGQNFRWIYDLDHDDILVTNVGGVCEVVDTSSAQFLPYTYHFQGTPGFTGVDCCGWRVDSPQTGTVGTGQALFFHNLDASNPANMPPDTDLDGIRNICDNCVSVPNGPLRGSCRVGPTIGAPCRSNQECGAGGICSLAQEDANGDFTGDVCAPEPGFAAGLVAGLSLIAARARRRTRR